MPIFPSPGSPLCDIGKAKRNLRQEGQKAENFFSRLLACAGNAVCLLSVLILLDQLPARNHQHGCQDGAHDAVGNVFAELAAQEDAGERADEQEADDGPVDGACGKVDDGASDV